MSCHQRLASRIAALLTALILAACSSGDQATSAAGDSNPDAGNTAPDTTDPSADTDRDDSADSDDSAPVETPLQMAFVRSPARSAQAASPLVLLHEFGLSSAQWAALIPLLNETRDVIAFDWRGHGASAKPLCCYQTVDFIADLSRALDAQGLQKVHLMGAGAGGFIAQHFAAQFPDRIDKLMLAGSDSTATDNPAYQSLFVQAGQLPATDEPAEPAFLQAYNAGNALPELSLQQLAQMQAQVPARVWPQLLANMAQQDATEQLASITAPTLLLWGGNDPVFGQPSRNRLRTGLLHEVGITDPAAGRFPVLAQMPAATAINQFLAPRGTLHASGEPAIITAAQIDQLTSNGIERLLLREVTGDADCDVEVRTITYQTTGGAGESTTATAGVAVPVGGNPVCNGPRPLVLYAHGSSANRNYNIVTSNEGFSGIAGAVFAARGYLVVAPNYAGYQDSWLDYHPYLNANAQADDMIDALRAARALLAGETRVSEKQLFLSGYSQGGHVAMATHRRMELHHADEFTVSASFPMSGPYSLEQTLRESLSGRNSEGASQLLPFIADSWQRAYGNLYASPADIYEAPYDQTASGLFPGELSASDTVRANLLPEHLLASQGAPWLLKGDYVAQVLADGEHPFRRAARLNTPLDWAPRAPMAMCGGGKDETVFFDNTYRARDAFRALGVEVPYFDFNDSSTLPSGRTNTLYLRFRSIYLFRRNLDGYHVALAPYCARLARDFFSKYLQ